MKQTALILNWHPYLHGLRGQVFGHPKFKEGDWIVTSRIIKLDEENKVCETLNTIFTLGKKLHNAPETETVLARGQD